MNKKTAIVALVVVAVFSTASILEAQTVRKYQSPGPRVYSKQQSSARAEMPAYEAEPAPAPAPRPAPVRNDPPPPNPGYGRSIPPNARAGECYVQVLVPTEYDTITERVMVREASKRIEIQPAEYEWVEEQVLVREASKRLEVVPAEYKTVKERVLITPQSERLVEVPAQYETVTERVLVKPAHTVWKEGRGPLEKLDNTTGEIVCLVEVPAEYKTLTKTVLKSPATTRKEVIPAVYDEIEKTVMVKGPTTREVVIPAEYKTVKVQKLVRPAREVAVEIPAEYTTVSRQVVRKSASTDWRQIICETNITPELVTDMQIALQKAGFYNGPVDGILTPAVLNGLESYQRSKGLPTGGITFETLRSLNVKTTSL